ncbi:MAG: glycosyltransferase family 2 protein, partial [Mobilicoccus sp.]|nr:glycosyltransferase family 2 protein [Mobilicoccus sp.]
MTTRVSVVVPCHDEARVERTLRAVQSLREQSLPPSRIVLAVDGSPALADRLRRTLEFAASSCTVVENHGERGAGPTRNAGAAAADTEFVAFLDDDEIADPRWLELLLAPLLTATSAEVAGTGGRYLPAWVGGRPAWFPAAFGWVVGAH